MVRVERFAKWFCITNDKGGYGSFVLVFGKECLWVEDVRGKNIIGDIYDYIRELANRLGLTIKTHLENKRLIRWFEYKIMSDSTISFDYKRNILTMVNNNDFWK